MKLYSNSIFIFHKSFRLYDNLGLIEALKNSDHVICIFIFTPEQIGPQNKFRSINAVNFMVDALDDLNKSLKEHHSKLYYFYGDQSEVIEKIIKKDDLIEAVYINQDYTKYAIERENKIQKVLEKHNIPLIVVEDVLLQPINSITNESGSFYSKFTPYYNKAVKLTIPDPEPNKYNNYIKSNHKIKDELSIDEVRKILHKNGIDDDQQVDDNIDDEFRGFVGSRDEALKKVNAIKNQKLYDKNKDRLDKETTKLSPYIKFGLVSIREIYHKIYKLFGRSHPLIRQLFWRDFYYNLAFNREDIFTGSSFKEVYDTLKWNKNSTQNLKKWEKGQTGFPIVDAGMRELNQTGFMHNRARLITANFLVKLLLIDWRKGEKYYSSKLIDYDPSVNNGNWQWVAGSGADSQPYFRIFNPWLQSEKFDPDCEYIKKYIPELKDVPNEDIHNWNEAYTKYENVNYPEPIVDYLKAKNYALKVYSKIFK